MADVVFLDTNIIVYAYDRHDKRKHERAKKLIFEELSDQKMVISSQVVGEFCNVMLTKKGVIIEDNDLQTVLQDVLQAKLAHLPSIEFYERAAQLFANASISFYDALIVQAALDLNCDVLYSADLQDGQKFGKLQIVNPFKEQSK
ncbi:MAG: PIN domain-containing protein [Candidatus Saccharimonadales bacterium]